MKTLMRAVAALSVVCPACVHPAMTQPSNVAAVTGRAVFVGTRSERETINIGNDKACAEVNLESGAVLLDPAGNLQNVFVYVKEGLKTAAPFEPPATSVLIDQRQCQFSPRVVGVQVGPRSK